MFEEMEATRFDRVMGSGKTRPILIACDTQEGFEVEVVAKYSLGSSVESLIREAICALFALDLGLPVPVPYLVRFSPAFIDVVPDADIAKRLQKSDGYGFGSKRLPNGFAQWIRTPGQMASLMEMQALDIMAFDCWTTNPDRSTSNHNMLTDGASFAIFDHEMALMTTLNLLWRAPWTKDALIGVHPPADHVFVNHLRSRSPHHLQRISGKLAALPDSRITEYGKTLPASWTAHASTISTVLSFIADLRNNVTLAVQELERALA